jgi:hypothetical protein
MTITTISKPGLWLIGLLVAILWGFVIADHLIVRRAQGDAAYPIGTIRSLQRMRHSKGDSGNNRSRIRV